MTTAQQQMKELADRRHAAAVAQVSTEDEAIAALRRYVHSADLAGLPGDTLEASLKVRHLRTLLRYIDEHAATGTV